MLILLLAMQNITPHTTHQSYLCIWHFRMRLILFCLSRPPCTIFPLTHVHPCKWKDLNTKKVMGFFIFSFTDFSQPSKYFYIAIDCTVVSSGTYSHQRCFPIGAQLLLIFFVTRNLPRKKHLYIHCIYSRCHGLSVCWDLHLQAEEVQFSDIRGHARLGRRGYGLPFWCQ